MVDLDFSPYLEFVRTSPRYHETLSQYTATDAIDMVLEAEMVVREEGEGREFREQKQRVERFPVLEGLRKYASHHVLLSGKPGCGKSTTLKRLLLEMARDALAPPTPQLWGEPQFQSPPELGDLGGNKDLYRHRNPVGEVKIPVLLQLKSNRPILDAIRAEFRQGKLSVTTEEINNLLLAGKLFLLLDGVNEIPSEELRRELQEFRENNLDTPMIFTTRDLAVGGDFGIEKKLAMRPLTDSQMREFVGKYLPEYGDLLLRQLEHHLREVAETPLLLKMLCEVFDPQTKQIPKSKGELFRAFDGKYHQHKQNPPVSGDFRRFQPEVLQHLAFEMMGGDREKPTEAWLRISRQKAEGILESWLGKRQVADGATKAKEWLEDLLEHHLLQIAADGREIEFHHQLFQEYYAAEKLLVMLENRHPDVMDDGRLQHFYFNYLKWTEPVALMLGLLKDEVQALRMVKLALAVDLQLGARLAGEVKPSFQVQTVGMVSGLEIPEWFKFKLWENTRSEAAIPGLLTALTDENSSVRRSAADALGKINSPAAIPGLLTALTDENSSVRRSAADALGKINSPEAIPGLLTALRDENSDVRRSAAEALGKIGSPAIPELLAALTDENSSVRWSAANVLGEIGSPAAIPGLLQALTDENIYVRGSAAEALGEIGSPAAISGVLQALTDEDFYVRGSAAIALGEIGSLEAISQLLIALEDEDDVRWCAAMALGKIGSPEAIPGLLQALADENSSVRWSAANVLGEIGSPAAIPGLLQALADKDINLRHSALHALNKIDSPEAIPGFLIAFADKYMPQSATDALGKISSPEVIPRLLRALGDEDSLVRKYAAEALGTISSPEVIPELLRALTDEDSVVREIAVLVLGGIGSPEAIPGLIHLVENSADEDIDVFWIVTYALGKISSPEAIPGLLQALANENSSVRLSAFKALGKIEEDKAAHILPHLLTLIPTESGKEALQAIANIQQNCQFYNYEIFTNRLPPVVSPQQLTEKLKLKTLQQINQGVQKMSETPKQDFTGATFNAPVNFAPNQGSQDVQNIETNYGTVINKQEQPTTEYIEKFISDFQQFILNLQQKYTQITDETAIAQIIDVEAKLLETSDKPRFANFLNLKRLWNGGKKAALKIGEHFVEENPWGKGAIAFMEGVTEDVEEKK